MAASSAGLLLFRRRADGLEVLLGHMGGPYWAGKEARAWTVPKGEHGADEDPHDAAVREFTEEVGITPPPGPEILLGVVRQSSGKRVTVWAREADLDVTTAVSNVFELEWPRGSGRVRTFPELDRLAWVPVEQARRLVVTAQVDLLDSLVAGLAP